MEEKPIIISDEHKLYEATKKGDAAGVEKLLQQDPLLLNKISYSLTHKPPLHIATTQKNLNMVQLILRNNLQLAEELDSQKSSALHIVAAKGTVEIVDILLSAAPKMCWSRDCHGMNPSCVAAVNGHVPVLEKLLVGKARFAAMERLDRGETVLHLCVKHSQLEALQVLVEILGEFVCVEDDAGETVLHLAVRFRQVEMIKYLVENTKIDKKSKNSKGQTPLQILKQGISHSGSDPITERITGFLESKSTNHSSPAAPTEWLATNHDSIMVVAILIATMAFQAAVSPTGGVWQDDTPPHRAGEAVMAYNNPKIFKNFIRSNTVAFVTSLSTILLLISGLPCKYRVYMWALMAIMWVSVTAVGVTYTASVMAVTPMFDRQSLSQAIKSGIRVWTSVAVVLLVGNILRLLLRRLRRARRDGGEVRIVV